MPDCCDITWAKYPKDKFGRPDYNHPERVHCPRQATRFAVSEVFPRPAYKLCEEHFAYVLKAGMHELSEGDWVALQVMGS